MAIIPAARDFEGSDMSGAAFGRIIKEHVRLISFRDDKNKQGNFFFILPSYKVDRSGAGVWFKSTSVRQDFGVEKRESYVPEDDDPVAWFENQARIHFPAYCQAEEVTIKGSKRKKYPTFGRITKKVMYNCAYVNDLPAGAHVLIVPVH